MIRTEPQFHENWFDAPSCEALAKLYAKVAHLDGDVVEVGCWEGRSTIALANACHPEWVRAVDTWQGSPGEISEELAKDRDVEAVFLANTAGLNVTPFKMGWSDYFTHHAGPTKFLHIDAEHSYEQVRGNIEAALPHMVPGAVMCGDDQHHPPVRNAVLDVFPEAQAIATLWFTRIGDG